MGRRDWDGWERGEGRVTGGEGRTREGEATEGEGGGGKAGINSRGR